MRPLHLVYVPRKECVALTMVITIVCRHNDYVMSVVRVRLASILWLDSGSRSKNVRYSTCHMAVCHRADRGKESQG